MILTSLTSTNPNYEPWRSSSTRWTSRGPSSTSWPCRACSRCGSSRAGTSMQRLASIGLSVARFSNLKWDGQGDPAFSDRADRQHADPAVSTADFFSCSSRAMSSGGQIKAITKRGDWPRNESLDFGWLAAGSLFRINCQQPWGYVERCLNGNVAMFGSACAFKWPLLLAIHLVRTWTQQHASTVCVLFLARVSVLPSEHLCD